MQVLNPLHKSIQFGIVGNVRNLFLAGKRILLDGLAVYENLPFLKIEDSAARFERGRLPRAVVPDKAVELPCLNVQSQAVHRFFVVVTLR